MHPSLLPQYKGAAPIPYALLNDDSITGATIIEVSDRMDAGKILNSQIYNFSLFPKF